MKKINSIYGLLAILFISFVACKKDEVLSSAKGLKLDATEVVISEGESKTINITSGNGDYKVVPSSPDNVSAVVDKNTILITGKKSGTSKLTVSDAKDKKATVDVKVTSSLTVGEEKKIILHKGAVKKISILTGEGNYTVNSNNDDVAAVELKGSSIEITAVASGEAVITIKDTVTKEEKTISVSVKDFIASKNEAEVYVGKTEEITVSGSEGFTLSNSDDSVATATASDNKITITAKKVGTTQLTITDNDTKQEVVVAITVSEELVLSKYSIEIPRKSFNTDVSIETYKDKPYEYMEQYDVEVTEGQDVIEVEKQHYDGIGHHVKVTSKGKIGTAKFKIKDKNTNEEKEVTVTITPVNLNISLFPKQLSLQVGETKEVKFVGNGDYEISYSQEGFVTTTANETDDDEKATLIIEGVKEGTTTITIKDKHTEETDELDVTVTPEKTAFVVDENGVLESVEDSAIVPELVIPENIKSIPDYFSDKEAQRNPHFEAKKKTVITLTAEGLQTIGILALRGFANLEEVILGRDLTELGDYVFYGSKKITKVTVRATTPPANKKGSKLFSKELKQNATLYVPEQSIQAYKESHWAQYFAHIEAISAQN